MKISRKVGATSQILQVFIQDSSSITGAGLTGLVFNSASLTAYYHRDTDTTATAITLVTMTVGTFTSSGFKEIDATNMPGWYQFCPPNAALASGAASVGLHLKGATNMAPLPIEVDLSTQVDVALWNGTAVATPATAGIPDVNTKNLGNTAQTGRDIGASVLLSSGSGTGQLDFTSGVVKANATQILGTAVSTPATAGILDVNLKNIANAVVDTTVAQIGANTVKVGGTTQTARDLGASVLLSSGTGTGQLDFTSGVVKANLAQILGTALTETAGLLAGAFKKFFNVATPTGTVNSIPDAVAGAAGGLFIAGSNAATTANITGNITGNLSGSVGSVTGAVGSVTGAVGSVTGNVGGNVAGSVGSVTGAVGSVTGAVGSVAANGITSSSIATDAINAASVKADAVTKIQNGLSTASALATVQADTDDIQTRLPAALVSGRIDASVGAMATDTLTSAALAASAVSEIQSGLATSAALATVQADTDDIQSRLPAALVGGKMDSYSAALEVAAADPSALGGTMASSVTRAVKLDWLFARLFRKNMFNKVTGAETVYNSSDAAIAKMIAADDGTTTSRAQAGAP